MGRGAAHTIWLAAVALLLGGMRPAAGQTFSAPAAPGCVIPSTDVFADAGPREVAALTPVGLNESVPAALTAPGAIDGSTTAPNLSPCFDSGAPGCESPRSLSLLLGYEAFRGISDGDWENNGINVGLNFGTKLGAISDWTGVGFQIGGTVGVYDWSGADYRLRHQSQAETQGFITYGLFRRASAESPWSAGLVNDWMLNDNFSVFAQTPTLLQWRWQAGYAVSPCDEYGFWGTFRGDGDSRTVPFFGSVGWRPLTTYNFFWHHHWQLGADTWLSLGALQHERLTGGGSLGEYVARAWGEVPLNDRFTLYSDVAYMRPSAAPGPAASVEDAWDFTVGMAFYFGSSARMSTVAGDRWRPLMPVANNSTMLVDASRWY